MLYITKFVCDCWTDIPYQHLGLPAVLRIICPRRDRIREGSSSAVFKLLAMDSSKDQKTQDISSNENGDTEWKESVAEEQNKKQETNNDGSSPRWVSRMFLFSSSWCSNGLVKPHIVNMTVLSVTGKSSSALCRGVPHQVCTYMLQAVKGHVFLILFVLGFQGLNILTLLLCMVS